MRCPVRIRPSRPDSSGAATIAGSADARKTSSSSGSPTTAKRWTPVWSATKPASTVAVTASTATVRADPSSATAAVTGCGPGRGGGSSSTAASTATVATANRTAPIPKNHRHPASADTACAAICPRTTDARKDPVSTDSAVARRATAIRVPTYAKAAGANAAATAPCSTRAAIIHVASRAVATSTVAGTSAPRPVSRVRRGPMRSTTAPQARNPTA